MHAQKDLITTHDLTRVYRQGEVLVTALDKVNLSINSGEFIAVVGPSGSGKTTLLNMIGGLDTPSEGHVALSGSNIDTMSQRKLSQTRRDHIGFIFQFFNLIPVLNVEENTEYVMLLQGISADERKDRVRAILKDVGLEGMETANHISSLEDSNKESLFAGLWLPSLTLSLLTSPQLMWIPPQARNF